MNTNCFSNQSLILNQESNKSIQLNECIENLKKNNFRLAVSYSKKALDLKNDDFSALMLHTISLLHIKKFQESRYYKIRAKNSASTDVQIEACERLLQIIDYQASFNLIQ